MNNTETTVLDKVFLQSNFKIPRQLLVSTEIERVEDTIKDGLIFHFRSILAGTHIATERVEESARVPISWWDHVKGRFFPEWYLKSYPAKYRTIETKIVTTIIKVCPHIEFPPNDKRHFEYLERKEGDQ